MLAAATAGQGLTAQHWVWIVGLLGTLVVMLVFLLALVLLQRAGVGRGGRRKEAGEEVEEERLRAGMTWCAADIEGAHVCVRARVCTCVCERERAFVSG